MRHISHKTDRIACVKVISFIPRRNGNGTLKNSYKFFRALQMGLRLQTAMRLNNYAVSFKALVFIKGKSRIV